MKEFFRQWPVLILGAGIGISFLSFWFLRDRKVKLFLIVLLIGLVLSIIGTCNFSGNNPDSKNRTPIKVGVYFLKLNRFREKVFINNSIKTIFTGGVLPTNRTRKGGNWFGWRHGNISTGNILVSKREIGA